MTVVVVAAGMASALRVMAAARTLTVSEMTQASRTRLASIICC